MSKVTLLDGGLGQELLRRSKRAPTPLWSADVMLKEPELVRDLHVDYIRSGASILTLNTYSATPERLQRENAGEHLQPIHQSAMSVAKEAIDIADLHPVSIAGCLPPLVASYRPDLSLPENVTLETYRRLVELQSPAADLFLCETMASIDEARLAATAALESGKPVWLAMSVKDDQPDQLRSGENLADALTVLGPLGLDAILLNCSHPEAIEAAWPQLQGLPQRIGAYANAFVSVDALQPGGTVDVLKARKDLGPEQYARHAVSWVNNGASIVGGCCEVGPAHIKALHTHLIAAGLMG
ncbi:MAG: homocysteine S-methyltransferase family protein [Granulosicoccus sp.]